MIIPLKANLRKILIIILFSFWVPLIAGCYGSSKVDPELIPKVAEHFLLRLAYYITDHPSSLSANSKLSPHNVYTIKDEINQFIELTRSGINFTGQFSAAVEGIQATSHGPSIYFSIPSSANVIMKIEGSQIYEFQILEGDFF